MIDRPEGGERAVLVHINLSAENMREDLTEFEELARSAGAEVVGVVVGTRALPEPSTFVGMGKAEEIRARLLSEKAQLVLFNHALSPAQERNLEKILQCRVVDRTGLILDIFAQRARSFEGKLQVELAFLKHLSTRLVRGWTHLERQRGGIGVRGGPGETQLETDRRLIRRRIQFITKRLIKVRAQRQQSRKARRRAIVPTVALVGYTNAGKSTLFNQLTGNNVYVANRLFATLDPTLRRTDIPEIGAVIFADTVGFIRHLPHDLVEAFKATLEEVAEADLLLHVVDASDARRELYIQQVNEVLALIGGQDVPQILVFNKMDLCEHFYLPLESYGDVKRVCVSAEKGTGFKELGHALKTSLGKNTVQRTLVLSPDEGRMRAELYQLKAVLSEHLDESGCSHLLVRLPKTELERLYRQNQR